MVEGAGAVEVHGLSMFGGHGASCLGIRRSWKSDDDGRLTGRRRVYGAICGIGRNLRHRYSADEEIDKTR